MTQVARQTSSLFVVAFGAGLCGLVFWAVGTELFSENSPTRIFEDIVERLERDDNVTCFPSLYLSALFLFLED